MAILKLQFKLNPGREGIALGKLSKQTENIEMFLRSLASDLGVDDSGKLWLAKEFENGSLIYTSEYQANVNNGLVYEFNDKVYDLVRFRPSEDTRTPSVSPATVERFSRLRDGLDPDEKIGIGIFNAESSEVEWNYLNRLELEEIGNAIETETTYVGAVIGQTHEWNKGATPPYIYIREILSGELVKCVYKDDDYPKVAKLFQNKNSVVNVYGTVKLNRITQKHEITSATDFDIAPDFTDEDYEKFFGCDPDFTNGLTGAEFIAKRRNGEH